MTTTDPETERVADDDTPAPPRTSSRLPLTLVVAGLVIVLGSLAVWRAGGDDAATVPYDDPQSAGLLTLCAGGQAVTGGSVGDQPFADVALGQTALPAGYDPAGVTATLFAYQPREGIATSEFSGSPLTAAAPLVEPDRAAARISEDGWSIGDFVSAFPATFDGYVQLRLYLSTPAAGTLTDQPYDTADLRVDGDSWELVRGGNASCADAESVLAP